MPYWFNPIIVAHREGVISDEKFKEYFEKFPKKGAFVATRLGIIALNAGGVPTVAIDARDEIPSPLESVYKEAVELSKKFPDSVKLNSAIQDAIRQGIPDDSIAAMIVTDALGKNGNGLVTYGAGHMIGICNPKNGVSGILDDALKAQDARVLDGAIIGDRERFAGLSKKLHKQKLEVEKNPGGLSDSICQLTVDERDYVYLTETDSFLHGAALDRGEFPDLLVPSDGLPTAEEAFKPHELNPFLRTEFQKAVQCVDVEESPTHSSQPREFSNIPIP